MILTKISLSVLLIGCLAINSYSQTFAADVFVGSTPCDSLIRSTLKFPPGSEWDHVRWELKLSKNNAATFELSADYVAINPQTNMYVETGIKTFMKGKYTTLTGVNKNPNLKYYRLEDENRHSSLFLVEMDNNILHFADNNKNFIVGNSGFGYVLNRRQKN